MHERAHPAREFSPAFTGRHLQTIYGSLFRRMPRVAVTMERWETPDEDVLDVDLLPLREGVPGIVALHGLEGSSRAKYVRGTLARAAARGLNGAAINFRSCGPSAHRHPRTYHSGFTDDLDWIVQKLAARWRAPVGAVGFSLGGNVTLKWLGERGDACAAAAAVGVSVPYDLAACARALDGPGFWAKVYRGRFMRTLRRKALASTRRFPGVLDADRVRRARTFAEFDDCVTARLFDFRSAADYWARSSSAQFLPGIRRPTLLVSAEDDPFIPASAIPREVIAKNPALTLALSAHGGHVGFVEGSFFAPSFAAERMAVDFLAERLARRS